MLKKLRELSSTTPISQLPEIFNHNNNVINEGIDYIFDASNGRLIRSVYVPQGKVQAYTGEFRTLTVDSIQINNPTTIINNIVRRATDIPHNAFANNFSAASIEYTYEIVNKERDEVICHDASVIAFPSGDSATRNIFNYLGFNVANSAPDDTITLYNVIINTTKKIQSIEERVAALEEWKEIASMLPADSNGITEPENPDDYKNKPVGSITTYPKSYMYSTIVQLKRQGINPLHINDLKENGNHIITYYPVSSPMEVNNNNYIGIECWQVGRVIDIKFKNTATNTPFMFLLNRNNKNNKREYLEVTYAPLNCLQLRCAGYTDNYGTLWDVYNWSGNPDNFKIVEI